VFGASILPTGFSSNYFFDQFSDEPETVYVDIIIYRYCESCAFGNLSILVGLILRYIPTLRCTSNQLQIFFFFIPQIDNEFVIFTGYPGFLRMLARPYR